MPPEVLENALLSSYTTFQLGGPCRGLICCGTPEECINAVEYLNNNNEKFILIGGGSNLVVSDDGLDCYVIRYVSKTVHVDYDNNNVTVSGSTSLDAFVTMMVNDGRAGVTFASGIPGTVGGAVVGNAGAFGQQVGDVIKSVTLLSLDGKSRKVTPDALGFSYRYSKLREMNDIVLDVTFTLTSGLKEDLLIKRNEILELRKEKHPDLKNEPCAGSFFRNVEPTSSAKRRQAAGWFLDQVGGKALRSGGAYIFEKHANIIVKGSDCSAEDVYQLSTKMRELAKTNFDIDLIREVRFVGAFNHKPNNTTSILW
ncbi:MAG: UDP-N-acetylmuramate dehydrogenase [Candidatus Omnitrophota bacterium]